MKNRTRKLSSVLPQFKGSKIYWVNWETQMNLTLILTVRFSFQNKMSLEQLRNSNRLLQEYSKTLQKQNSAKNIETTTLYNQIQELTEENKRFRSLTLQMSEKCSFFESQLENEQLKIRSLEISNQQLENQFEELQRQFDSIREESADKGQAEEQSIGREKELLCESHEIEKQELLQYIDSLEKKTQSLSHKLTEIQDRKRKYAKRIKQLQDSNNQLKQALETTSQIGQASFSKLDVDKLVKDNNQLIEKVRLLEKEKNQYYSELKSVSPVRDTRHRDHSRRKTLTENRSGHKAEHYHQMQERINAIKSENQQIKANLAIR